MRKNKKMLILVILLLLLLMNINKSLAQTNIQIIPDKNTIEKDEEVGINIELNNIQVASFTLEIFWNEDKLEYVKGPENSNYSNNKLLYTWVSENGQNKDNIKISDFIFKGVEEGIANIVVTGEFYNINGERVNIENGNLEIKIGNLQQETKQVIEQQENVADNNANLSVLRLDHEGISPEFNKDIKEYYFVANKTIDNLKVTAIPANSGATVTITGNNSIKYGKNTISIRVESKDKTKTETYQIYVTKTDNVESANANLETLAVRQADLNPEFDSNITKYKIEIANDINKLDILAIPQREKANVIIAGNNEMKIGDNKVEVTVTAEDGITTKKYELIVHRRNEEEQIQSEKEHAIQVERLSAILEQEEQEEQKEENPTTESENNIFMISSITIVAIVIVGIAVYVYYKKRIDKRK